MEQDGNNSDLNDTTHQPITEVVIDGLAVLKIMKHCNDNIPTNVAGSLLGLDYNGVLEISYTFPFLSTKPSNKDADPDQPTEPFDELEGAEYQVAMMRMLEDVDVDNNCVGWYQSAYLGALLTNEVVNCQFTYQSSEVLTSNTVVIIYDPFQSKNGKIILKAFKLSDKFMEIKQNDSNEYIAPSEILQELPITIKNVGHISAFLYSLQTTHKNQLNVVFEPLSLASSDTFTEKQLEFISTWIDDFIVEQQRFILYAKSVIKSRQDHSKWLNKRLNENAERYENGETLLSTRFEDSNLRPIPEVSNRTEALLEIGQLNRFSDQLNQHIDSNLQKLVLTSQINQLI